MSTSKPCRIEHRLEGPSSGTIVYGLVMEDGGGSRGSVDAPKLSLVFWTGEGVDTERHLIAMVWPLSGHVVADKDVFRDALGECYPLLDSDQEVTERRVKGLQNSIRETDNVVATLESRAALNRGEAVRLRKELEGLERSHLSEESPP